MIPAHARRPCDCVVCGGTNKDARCVNQLSIPGTQLDTRHGRTFEVETLNVGSPAPAPKRGRAPKKRFTQISATWEEVLGKELASGTTYAVSIVLIHEAWRLVSRGYKPIVKLTDVMLKRVHVGRRGKREALRKLEELKLVAVERRVNKNPLVTVCFID